MPEKSVNRKRMKVLSEKGVEEHINELQDAEESTLEEPRKEETDETVLWLRTLKDKIIQKQPTAAVSIFILNQDTIRSLGLPENSLKATTRVYGNINYCNQCREACKGISST